MIPSSINEIKFFSRRIVMDLVKLKTSGASDCQELLSKEGYVKDIYARRPLSKSVYIAIALALVLSNLTTLAISFCSFRRRETGSISSSEISFFGDIDRTQHTQTFSPFSIEENAYTARPSETVDQAWADLGINYWFLLVPEEHASELKLTHNHVFLPPGENLTHGGYAANLDALHQLHCVNLLRKAVFYNYDYYAQLALTDPSQEFNDEPDVVIGHVNHCLNMMRELLMCRADTDITPYYWADRKGHSMPDFAREKKCHNFESLRQFGESHQTFLSADYTYSPPADVKLFGELAGGAAEWHHHHHS